MENSTNNQADALLQNNTQTENSVVNPSCQSSSMPKLNACQIRRQDRDYRRALILSALGILLSPFVVIGLILAFFGIANARNELAYLKDESLKPSQTLLWAYWLGITGIIVNAGVFVVYLLYAIL